MIEADRNRMQELAASMTEEEQETLAGEFKTEILFRELRRRYDWMEKKTGMMFDILAAKNPADWIQKEG